MASGIRTTSSTAAPPHSPVVPITHFSHPHELHPLFVSSSSSSRELCSACRLQSSGVMYTCLSCTTFAIHQSCADLPRHVTHPSHSGCVLSIVEKASYPGGMFSCDGCRLHGEGWAYHCANCEFDLHVTCACRPLRIRVPAHASCDLHLVFGNPYRESNGFACDVCRKIGAKQWLYRCAACEFDVHLDCAAASSQDAIVLLQNRQTFPPAGSQSAHSACAGQMDFLGIPLSSPAQARPALRNRQSFPLAGSQSVHSACAGETDVLGSPLSSPALARPALQNRDTFPAMAVQAVMQDFGGNPISTAGVRPRRELMHIGSGGYGEIHQLWGRVAGSAAGAAKNNDETNPEKGGGGRGNVRSLK